MRPANHLVLAVAASGITLVASNATATVYTYDLAVDNAAATCGVSGDVRYCENFYAVTPASDNVGDQYKFNITFDQREYVPGSATNSSLFVGFYDSMASYNAVHHDASESQTSSVVGYLGPPGLITSFSYAYDGYYGVVGFFTSPNPGFSVTGLNSTVDVLTQDPFPLGGLVVAWQATIPEPATWAMMLTGLALVGATLRRKAAHPKPASA